MPTAADWWPFQCTHALTHSPYNILFIIMQFPPPPPFNRPHTDKKEIQVFLIYKEIQNGAVAKSYKTNGLLIYGVIFAHLLIY